MIAADRMRESKLFAMRIFPENGGKCQQQHDHRKPASAPPCASGHRGRSLSAGKSQPPREMAIPFKRCSLFLGAGTWME